MFVSTEARKLSRIAAAAYDTALDDSSPVSDTSEVLNGDYGEADTSASSGSSADSGLVVDSKVRRLRGA